MKIIVPMAGRGSRLRPHTLTVPKPLVPVGGKPIVHRLVEDIAACCSEKITDIGFVIGDFGVEVERELILVAEKLGAKGHIFHQKKPLGTAHAVLCAESLLDGPIVVAFADTLFKADFSIDSKADGVLWVSAIDDPSQFGVVKLTGDGSIIDFVEKPKDFVSNLAMIGIYYFKRGEELKTELNYLIEHHVIKSGEYQLPDALRRLTEKGTRFFPGEVREWLDCGNKEATVHSNQRVLINDASDKKELVSKSAKIINSIIIQPCYVGPNAHIENSVVGPHVSVGPYSRITDCRIENSIIQHNTTISALNIKNSMIGSNATVSGKAQDLSIGDYSNVSY